MTPLHSAHVLRAAARTLREGGWCQGTLRRGESNCAYGAILANAGGIWDAIEVMNFLAGYLELPPGPTVPCTVPVIHPIPQWNDVKGRTKDQVIEAFEGCAASLEPQVIHKELVTA